MYQLGVAYTNGSGVQKDYANALHWLARSVAHEGAYGANPVRSQAQNAIGLIYENGYGVAKDLVLAYAWYNLASTDGSQEIQKNLTRLAELLKPEQRVEAEGLARGWKAGNQITRRT
jgi:TPR repeat protein